jgi:hypothetical protein
MKWTGTLVKVTIPGRGRAVDGRAFLAVSEPYVFGHAGEYSPTLHVVDVVYKGETRPIATRSLVRVP